MRLPAFRLSLRRSRRGVAAGIRHVALKGRSPVKVPLCAEDAAVTEDEGLFDEKGYLVGLCPGHAAMVISQAVEGLACTGEACSGHRMPPPRGRARSASAGLAAALTSSAAAAAANEARSPRVFLRPTRAGGAPAVAAGVKARRRGSTAIAPIAMDARA